MQDSALYLPFEQAAPGRSGVIRLHGPEAFEGMRRAGQVAAEVLDAIGSHIRPGVTTGELDQICHDMILSRSAVPAPLGYRGFPKSICTSVNHVVCHGIPGDKVLDDGDVVNIDVTVIVDGWHGDTSRMFYVGNVGLKARRLCEVTYDCLMAGISAVKPGARLGDIGHAIQTIALRHNFSVVTDFCGHGLGRLFHDEPNILHYGEPDQGHQIKPGMFFTIEPMINAGKAATKMLPDGWTAVTRDRALSAQFEHSIGVTETGAEIFTSSPAGLNKPPFG